MFFFLGVICFNCWVWVADVFRDTHVCIDFPCFVIVIDELLSRLPLGGKKRRRRRKKLFTAII